jgi:hypothetical protein
MHILREEWDEAIPLAQELSALFIEVAAPIHAVRAYAFLREAVVARRASASLVEYIRRYVEAGNDADFMPPTV